MRLQLVTKTGVPVDEDVYEVVIPTSAGRIAVYDQHTPIITDIIAGVLSVRAQATSPAKEFTIIGGIAEIESHSVRILSDDVTSTETVNELEAEAAMKRASQILATATDKQTIEEARRQLAYSSLKLEVVKTKKRRNV